MKRIISIVISFALSFSVLSQTALLCKATSFANSSHGYAEIVENAITDTQVAPFCTGTGALYDVDKNGVDELLIVYDCDMSHIYSVYDIVKVCSAYTMSDGVVVPLIERKFLYFAAGAPDGYMGVVQKNGSTFLAVTSSNGGVFGDYSAFSGDWNLYTLNGTSLFHAEEVSYTSYHGFYDSNIDSKSFAIFNGQKKAYSDYTKWKKEIDVQFAVYGDEFSETYTSVMSLEDLLAFLTDYSNNQSVSGDLNDDGTLNDEDVALLLWHTLFPNAYPIAKDADFTKDGIVNELDVAYLLWHTLFPQSYPL